MSKHFENLRRIFNSAIKSVQPSYLINNSITVESNSLKINGISIEKNKNFHLIGFGKAVYGMAIEMEKILGKNLKSGILSVPIGTLENFAKIKSTQLTENSVLKVYEGAAHNLPDEAALLATKKILEHVKTMNSEDVLFILISGGGSALLSSPKLPLTLQKKLEIISYLQNKGASIEELNVVRITLSDIKGGKLSILAKNADKIISFIISDIVNDPLNLIASGPTVQCSFNTSLSKEILQKYKLWERLEIEIQNILEQSNISDKFPQNNYICLIGNNKLAVEACCKEAEAFKYIPIVLSTTISGNISDLSEKYIQLLKNIRKFQRSSKFYNSYSSWNNTLFQKELFYELISKIKLSMILKLPLLLILAGEPTVIVQGSGLGGRNQELSLKIALELYRNNELNDVAFLSAGTDGIDGPTDAAGGLACSELIDNFLVSKTIDELENTFKRNDSYNFYKNLEYGKYHIKTGHTGTNVMDIHLIVIPNV